jgi:hypothetical protein
MASPVSTWLQKGVAKTLWENLTTNTVTNGAESAPFLPDKTVFITGTFNSGVVTIEGSNAETATGPYVDLVDPQGNAISASSGTSPVIEAILENPRWIRPRVSGVGASALDVDVILISRASVR